MADEEVYEYARRGKTNEVREILEGGGAGPDDFLAYNGATALLMAARGGHLATVQLLVEHKANLEAQTDDLSGVLHAAVCGEGGDEARIAQRHRKDHHFPAFGPSALLALVVTQLDRLVERLVGHRRRPHVGRSSLRRAGVVVKVIVKVVVAPAGQSALRPAAKALLVVRRRELLLFPIGHVAMIASR